MSHSDGPSGVDQLLDRALLAASEGDRATAKLLAGQVLAVDRNNTDAEDLLAAPAEYGEIRRLTILFADLVDSTALSNRIDPETYRTIVGRYRDDVLRIVDRYEGHVGSTKGDGLLASFGHPHAHEDDVYRAVQAALDITRVIAELSTRVRRRFGVEIDVRVGIHRGIVYLDTAQDDVYGFAANLAARMCSLADPGTVAISAAVEPLVRGVFELRAQLPRHVKGVEDPVRHYQVIAERDMTRAALSPLVGREREYAHLQRRWADATAGTLRTPGVAIQGEAGIGKSRLAWSAAELAAQSHGTVLQLIGSPFHTDVGLRPIRRLLERRCGIDRTSEPAERLQLLRSEIEQRALDPATVLPLLAPLLGIDPQVGYQPASAEGRKLSGRICGAVRDYLLACVRDTPALVVVEDMHWFDEDTTEVIQSLLAADLDGHVLIVMTSREQAVPASALTEVLDLKPLSDSETDELIVALHPDATPDQRHVVRRRCDGVPLYIEEVVAKLRTQPSDTSSVGGVPDTLYEALYARLKSSSNAIRVAEAAAIIGSRVERSLLSAVVDLDEQEVEHIVGELVQSRVLEPLDQNSWRFHHELLREVAAELSPPSLRRELHSRIADTLATAAAAGNPDWPLIARHYERAERYTEAAAGYAQASANARQRGALREALSYLTHAVTHVEKSPPGPDRDHLEVNLRLGRAFLAQAAEGVFSPNAAADFERCLHLCSSDLQDDELLSTVMSLYPYYTMRADLERAQRLVESIRGSLVGPRRIFLPVNDFAFGMLAWFRGEFGYARTKMDTAARTLTEEGARALDAMLFMPNDPTAGLYAHLALSRCLDGDVAGVEAELGNAERRCAELPFPKGAFSLAYTRQIEVLIRIESGDLDRAAQAAVELGTIGEQHGFDSWELTGAAQHATVHALAALTGNAADGADLAPHIELLTGFVDTWRAVGVIALITFYDALLARLLIAARRFDEARARLQTGLELARQTRMSFYDAELTRLAAFTTDGRGPRRAALEAAMALGRSQDARVFELRSATDCFELLGEPARQALAEALHRFPSDCSWPDVIRARTILG
ncbi:guanylate cyclase [Mycolicibacterium conceptionense]|uniref:Guanylate cyclase n=1 Tax=Mycolicibacterium conceptionense TaxID=451644 RepID=A0A1A1ZPB0_9MYCO|nr:MULTISPECIES: adenylate/guanylate cyclase domain-containing protein [Mycolicibacterium]MCW1822586.1 AAA family ATPase [Mycolicibacterium senegalense]OBB09449.1 guanylate cyclase [Mycolicibacterium conceptionense]OBE96148.1 guanylate cyclase [Mycolicibacterium conceptionense]OBF27594.1 guanylate cyclase [Mycolicibacterium conceptionense]OBF45426.1 guanylate cyclase [Mycolicibacterium conceptionense]